MKSVNFLRAQETASLDLSHSANRKKQIHKISSNFTEGQSLEQEAGLSKLFEELLCKQRSFSAPESLAKFLDAPN